ncbi:hypothetical protein K466DRAFT_502299 [Polyporus arcularius HHB13444]|uniref:CBF1-interacting co-repressor CIR N-terminal domain-containing protein n=1 Tax=Polyporus arcularius HHB13444 TaxID=1314778 RepID=A0A5C3NVF7_9APHY|nr:hypothetical protein K466DRAFT_502299 [Polyporus arcularius HHB13444]
MGKLNIAHHKSYHPYRRDNIERVRKDEEEARQKEAVEEGRMMLADSEARMDLLRQRAGLAGPGSKGKRVKERDGEDLERAVAERDAAAAAAATETPAIAGPSSLTTTSGHINLFEDLERQTTVHMPVRSTKNQNLKGPAGAAAAAESEKGVPLAPSAKDLNPWYSDKDRERTFKETDDDRRIRDLARKSVHDPLTSINTQLASRDRSSVPSFASFSSRSRGRGPAPSRPPRAPPSQPEPRAPPPPSTERQTRESAERQRALELIRRKKREMAGSETPSTVRGGSGGGGGGYGYGDVFNRREVEEVHQQRSRRRDWDWDHRDRERDSERERDRFGSRRW